VWSPLPVITWFLPFIGHTGIGSSTGVLVSIFLNYAPENAFSIFNKNVRLISFPII
jgi:hypothetical protein